jgi:hypothetical protein
MPTQTIIITTVPYGFTDSGARARLSLVITPRLTDGAILRAFPDFEDWTQKLKDRGLGVRLKCGAKISEVGVNTKGLRPDLWRAIFGPNTPVNAYTFEDYSQRFIRSFGVMNALAVVKNLYQTTGATHGAYQRGQKSAAIRGQLRPLLTPTSGKDAAQLFLSRRNQEWDRQHGSAYGYAREGLYALPQVDVNAADGIPTSAQPLSFSEDEAMRFKLFHHGPSPDQWKPMPTASELASAYDFHQALTALTAYPSLMRALGLVLDIELLLDDVPVSPATPDGPYLDVSVVGLLGGSPWATVSPVDRQPITTYDHPQPVTAYVRTAAPAPSTGAMFAAAPAIPLVKDKLPGYGDIWRGLLRVEPGAFSLAQVDIDGALHALSSLSATDDGETDGSLPTLRSSGLSLIASARAEVLLARLARTKDFNQALAAKSPAQLPLHAIDLVRGYRIDIWDSATGGWRSLHQRHAAYLFDASDPMTVDEEGFIQLAVTQAPPSNGSEFGSAEPSPPPAGGPPLPSSMDLHLHERVVRWNGWSLSVPRPGTALGRSADPAKALDDSDPINEPITPFKMTTTFNVIDGSLPRLRFGRRYQMRARVVDVAGNSIDLRDDEPGDSVAPADGPGFPYLRYEPVIAPVLTPRAPTTDNGSSLHRMVIRSHNTDSSLDDAPTADQADRHLVPPRTSERMAEHHGMLDNLNGNPMESNATYDAVKFGDAAQLPTVAPDAQLTLDHYLPDPLARGAALRNLPGAPEGAVGAVNGGSLIYTPLPDARPRPGSVTHISFDSAWPSVKPFRLALVAGDKPPAWDATARELKVFLPKAGVATVDLSSYMATDDLELMGIWQWLREFFNAQHQAALKTYGATSSLAERLGDIADNIAMQTQLALEGGHPMLTPARKLTLVHAVQQPIGRPEFVPLWLGASKDQLTPPDTLTTEKEPYTPLRAWRTPGSHDAYLFGGLRVHGASTAKVDIEASWIDSVDNLFAPASGHVDQIPLHRLDDHLLEADGKKPPRYVGVYVREPDLIWFANEGDTLGDASNQTIAGPRTSHLRAAPLHHFNDTKHRVVRYKAVSATRFRDYFPPDPQPGDPASATKMDFTRTSEEVTVDVPSSARPAAPRIVYVVPTFGWERRTTTNMKTSLRTGMGLRVYLERPWYSSGEGELLGVTLWNNAPLGGVTDLTREQMKPYVTQWGLDPLWQTQTISSVPGVIDFPDQVANDLNLKLGGSAHRVDVAGHEVHYDPERELWFCDISFNTPYTYAPFVRLALARYQPHSLPGVELSHVVLADFAQLTPNRSAVVAIDPYQPKRLRVVISGLGPEGPLWNHVTVTVQQRQKGMGGDLGWTDTPHEVAGVTKDPDSPDAPDAALWVGDVTFASDPGSLQYRLLIREYEFIQAEPGTTGGAAHVEGFGVAFQGRLIYADVIAINPASSFADDAT